MTVQGAIKEKGNADKPCQQSCNNTTCTVSNVVSGMLATSDRLDAVDLSEFGRTCDVSKLLTMP